MLADAEEDILAFYSFPAPHWSKLRSTNPLERFNKEIGRRTDVVGIFPDDRSLIRLVGMLCLEQNDEWLVGRRYLSAAAMEPLLEQRLHRDTTPDARRPENSPQPEQLNALPTNVGANSYTTSWDLTGIRGPGRGWRASGPSALPAAATPPPQCVSRVAASCHV